MRNRAIPLAGLILAAASLTGCLIIPTNYYIDASRQNVSEVSPAAIVPGKTTRQDLLLTLGEPDASSLDETEFWYVATKTKAIIIIGNRGGDYLVDYIHALRFDRQGLVETVQLHESTSEGAEIRQHASSSFTDLLLSSPEPHFSREAPAPAQKE